MIEHKLFEVRDRMTFIPVMAVAVSRDRMRDPKSHWLLGKAGYGMVVNILLIKLNDGTCSMHEFDWPGDSRTMPYAHRYIQENFSDLEDGQVVDVEFLLGEKDSPSKSESNMYSYLC